MHCTLYFQALAERVQMTSPDHNLVKGASVKLDNGLFSRDMAVEPSAVSYLAYCYTRAAQEKMDTSVS